MGRQSYKKEAGHGDGKAIMLAACMNSFYSQVNKYSIECSDKSERGFS